MFIESGSSQRKSDPGDIPEAGAVGDGKYRLRWRAGEFDKAKTFLIYIVSHFVKHY